MRRHSPYSGRCKVTDCLNCYCNKITFDGFEWVKGSRILIKEHYSLLKRFYIKVRKIFNKNYGTNGVWVVADMGSNDVSWVMSYKKND